jgi:hypothetical protein
MLRLLIPALTLSATAAGGGGGGGSVPDLCLLSNSLSLPEPSSDALAGISGMLLADGMAPLDLRTLDEAVTLLLLLGAVSGRSL